jgi:RNA polymerase sigma-70 factor (ECF subfamily)
MFIRQERDEEAATDDRDSIRRALQHLPGGQREALVLVEWLGMSDMEAGEVLRVSPGAVRVRLTRARQALRVLLGGGEDA